MRKKLRPLGDITQDMEPLLFELTEKHSLQTHEILGIIKAWIDVHYPKANETYLDGTKPKLKGTFYG